MVEPWQRGTRYTPEFKAKAVRLDPTRLRMAGITYVRMADGSFVYAAFVTDVHARPHRRLGVHHHHEHDRVAAGGGNSIMQTAK